MNNQLKFITLTGADDSIEPDQLFELSGDYPFVEWGILVSEKRFGTARFPSKAWISMLAFLQQKTKLKLNLSLHLCGNYVSQLLAEGKTDFITHIGEEAWALFNRVQINTHGEPHQINFAKVSQFFMANEGKEFILQYDGDPGNESADVTFASSNENVSLLLDTSHGAGIERTAWRLPDPVIALMSGLKTSVGFAGGIGPKNIDATLKQTRQIIPSEWRGQYWLDMETSLRSNMDEKFDLSIVEEVLAVSSPWFEMPVQFIGGDGPGEE